MKKEIKLNDDIAINLPVLMETKLAVLANSGGGKSWAIRRIVEQSFGKVQIIIIDPESEYGNLRKEYDFILAGEGGEVVTKTHIAAKLAERLMDIKASAIIDLYDLLPQDRKKFVRLFIDSLMNLPKHVQTDVLLVIDEAHVFAPEGKPSESSTSMEALASQSRKRNIGVILATQRISKMSKDVLAECNNKMIGRMSLDIDRKRAGDELGFTSKEQVLSLRNLKPGEFYMFGSAISDEIITGKVGDVKILPPKRGASTKAITPPTAGVKKLIAQLADLPQEAEKEAKTAAELRTQLAEAKRKITQLERVKIIPKIDEFAIAKAVIHEGQRKEKEFFVERNNLVRDIKNRESVLQKIGKLIEPFTIEITGRDYPLPADFTRIKAIDITPRKVIQRPIKIDFQHKDTLEKMSFPGIETVDAAINQGEKKVLNAIAQHPDGVSKAHLYVLTGYKSTSLVVYSQKLTQKGYIEKTGDVYVATQAGIDMLGSDFKPLPEGEELRDHLLTTLPEGEKRVFEAVIAGASTKDELMEATGYKSTSVTVYIQKLSARKAIVNDRGSVSLNPKLL